MHFGHDVGAVPEDYLSYRVVPDDQAEAAKLEKQYLRSLQRVIDWQDGEGPNADGLAAMPEQVTRGLEGNHGLPT